MENKLYKKTVDQLNMSAGHTEPTDYHRANSSPGAGGGGGGKRRGARGYSR